MLAIKRVYDKPEQTDGFRVLVDRLWPRGVSHEEAALGLWLKDIAPSPELRVWFNHEADKFVDFSIRYEEELRANPATHELRGLLKQHKNITLLYAAHDPQINHAKVLLEFLQNPG